MTTLEKAIKFFDNEYEEVKRDLERADLLEHKKFLLSMTLVEELQLVISKN